RVAQALVGENFARHDETGALARVVETRRLARVDRIDNTLIDADGKRAAHLREPGIFGVPVARDREVRDLLLARRERPRRQTRPQVLARLEYLRQADVGVIRSADDAARLLGGVVDARLFGVHVGAVDDWNACHG